MPASVCMYQLFQSFCQLYLLACELNSSEAKGKICSLNSFDFRVFSSLALVKTLALATLCVQERFLITEIWLAPKPACLTSQPRNHLHTSASQGTAQELNDSNEHNGCGSDRRSSSPSRTTEYKQIPGKCLGKLSPGSREALFLESRGWGASTRKAETQRLLGAGGEVRKREGKGRKAAARQGAQAEMVACLTWTPTPALAE